MLKKIEKKRFEGIKSAFSADYDGFSDGIFLRIAVGRRGNEKYAGNEKSLCKDAKFFARSCSKSPLLHRTAESDRTPEAVNRSGFPVEAAFREK